MREYCAKQFKCRQWLVRLVSREYANLSGSKKGHSLDSLIRSKGKYNNLDKRESGIATAELYSHAACFSPLVFLSTSPAHILVPKILGVPFGNTKIDLLSHFTPFGALCKGVKPAIPLF